MQDDIRKEEINCFGIHLLKEERAKNTVQKYTRDVRAFLTWLGASDLDKEHVLAYKSYLRESRAPASVNAALASLNSFFAFLGREELKVKNVKIQRAIFADTDKELSKSEYEHLLAAAKKKKNERLYLLMQTICATGIRVSETRFITAEAITCGYADVENKGKCRRVFLPKPLCKLLAAYTRTQKIKSGAVFVTKSGKPLDRSNIWSDMKKLCASAGIARAKVFPHNLRHLFARTYYNLQKDIVRLADILGHTSVNTTRIYTMESGDVHRRQIESLGLVRGFCTFFEKKVPKKLSDGVSSLF